MNQKLLFLFLLYGVLILPISAGAQTIEDMMTNVIERVVWPLVIGLVVILWIVTGLLFLFAQGDPGKLDNAKKALVAALIGTVIVVISSIAITLVRNALGI